MKKRTRFVEDDHGDQQGREFLKQEHGRLMKTLNQAFSSWTQSSNMNMSWKNAVLDYMIYAKDLDDRYYAVSVQPKDTKGLAFSFGSGDCGQLGHGVENDSEDTEVSYPRIINTLNRINVLTLACGGLHNVLVSDQGKVYSWGCGDDNVLGREGDENYPLLVTGALANVPIVSVSCGDCHSVALAASVGTVFIWGAYKDKDGKCWMNIPGQEGDAFLKSLEQPVLLESLVRKGGSAIMIASGGNHTLALMADGSVYSWGLGEHGELGRLVGPMKDSKDLYRKKEISEEQLTPALTTMENSSKPLSNIRSIGCGAHHSFAISNLDGTIYGSGLNQYAQLGLGTATNQAIKQFKEIPALKGRHIAQIFGGEHFSAALTVNGHVLTWGRSDQSQLGVVLSEEGKKPGGYVAEPQLVKKPNDIFTNISCGGSHMLAVTSEGALYSWGFGVMLQLGNGKSEDEPLPFRVKTNNPVRFCGAGGQHSVIVELITP